MGKGRKGLEGKEGNWGEIAGGLRRGEEEREGVKSCGGKRKREILKRKWEEEEE